MPAGKEAIRMKNNVRGSIIILEAIAIVITAALIMRIKAGRDEFPPVISFPEDTVSYIQGEGPETLLSGVTAVDERDGDVTGSIIISSISVTGDGSAIAVYNAKDSSNNVAMAVRSVQFTPNDAVGLLGVPVNTEQADITILPDENINDQSFPEGTGIGDAAAGDAADSNAAAAQDLQQGSADSVLAFYENTDPDSYTGEDMERIGAALRNETETARESLPEGSPTIGLMVHAICQDIGSSLNPLDLISSIDDAEDSIDYIFGQIHVEGNAGFTTDYPGKYVFRYYVIDSDGNMSNVARLYVVVR